MHSDMRTAVDAENLAREVPRLPPGGKGDGSVIFSCLPVRPGGVTLSTSDLLFSGSEEVISVSLGSPRDGNDADFALPAPRLKTSLRFSSYGEVPAGGSGGLFDRDDFPSLVGAAVGACMVGQLGFMALRTRGRQYRFQKIVGPSRVLSGSRMSFYWIRHSGFLFL